jgi:hypothetical protein
MLSIQLLLTGERQRGERNVMDRIPPFNSQQLTAISKVLGDTAKGLTGSEIGYFLSECKVPDVTPDMTKWKRLFNAFAGWQKQSEFVRWIQLHSSAGAQGSWNPSGTTVGYAMGIPGASAGITYSGCI